MPVPQDTLAQEAKQLLADMLDWGDVHMWKLERYKYALELKDRLVGVNADYAQKVRAKVKAYEDKVERMERSRAEAKKRATERTESARINSLITDTQEAEKQLHRLKRWKYTDGIADPSLNGPILAGPVRERLRKQLWQAPDKLLGAQRLIRALPADGTKCNPSLLEELDLAVRSLQDLVGEIQEAAHAESKRRDYMEAAVAAGESKHPEVGSTDATVASALPVASASTSKPASPSAAESPVSVSQARAARVLSPDPLGGNRLSRQAHLRSLQKKSAARRKREIERERAALAQEGFGIGAMDLASARRTVAEYQRGGPDYNVWRAAQQGDITTVEAFVLVQGSELLGVRHNTAAGCGTLLHTAANAGHAKLVAWLLLMGVPVDAIDTAHAKLTALMEAARGGHFPVCRVLLRHGASVLRQNASGATTLHIAVQRGEGTFVRDLVRCAEVFSPGAITDAFTARDARSRTPLMVAPNATVQAMARSAQLAIASAYTHALHGVNKKKSAPALRGAPMTTVTWNIAAINNNPFEYWIEMDDPDYNELMAGCAKFIEQPGDKDVPIQNIFTQVMFDDLVAEMERKDWTGIDEVRRLWAEGESALCLKPIVSGFLKDKMVGKKRFISMPDRMTNTINTVSGKTYRPTPINGFGRKLPSMDTWWRYWKRFMFKQTITLVRMQPVRTVVGASELLTKIRHSKYPAVTEEEERISLPLQLLYLAIFDSVMLSMLNDQASPEAWHRQRMRVSAALNHDKFARAADLIEREYAMRGHIIFLQEVASAFVEQVQNSALGHSFHVLIPCGMDPRRDQNSIIMVRKDTFSAIFTDKTEDVLTVLKATHEKVPIAKGDLFAVVIYDYDRKPYFLASFHGDTNGLATIPVVEALAVVAARPVSDPVSGKLTGMPTLLIGIDANTYRGEAKAKQSLAGFVDMMHRLGYDSCWEDNILTTTHSARTHVQPQLQKATTKLEALHGKKATVEPKDFVLFNKSQMRCRLETSLRDNTGYRRWRPDSLFPTLEFPSDHAIVECTFDVAESAPDTAK